jgi:hypothetical protein
VLGCLHSDHPERSKERLGNAFTISNRLQVTIAIRSGRSAASARIGEAAPQEGKPVPHRLKGKAMKDPNTDVPRGGMKRLHMELQRSLNAPVRYRQAKPVTPTTTVKAARRRHRCDNEFCGGS